MRTPRTLSTKVVQSAEGNLKIKHLKVPARSIDPQFLPKISAPPPLPKLGDSDSLATDRIKIISPDFHTVESFKNMKLKRLCLLVHVVSLGSVIAAPFQNGSFESPNLGRPSSQVNLSGNELTGWTASGPPNSVALLNGRFGAQQFDPVDGVHQINFSGGNQPTGGALSQTFDTIPGVSYTVSFFVGRVGSGAGNVGVTASVLNSDSSILNEIRVTPPASEGYGPVSQFNFVATTSATTVRFTDTSSTTVAVDMTLDAVSVTRTDAEVTLNAEFYATLEIEGRVGTVYRIEFTQDMENWLPLTTLLLPKSPFLFTDVNSKGRPRRFYRIVQL